MTLHYPARPHTPVALTQTISEALGSTPECVLDGGTRLLAVFAHAQQIADLQPNMQALLELPQYGICCAAIGDGEYCHYDFVCRFFAPAIGIPEDPVTGSAYTALAPYFAEQLGKTHFNARQISKRGGNLTVRLNGDRVSIAGHAITFAKGCFQLNHLLT